NNKKRFDSARPSDERVRHGFSSKYMRGLLSCAVGPDEAGAQSLDRLGRREATGSMSRCPFWVISRHGSKSDQCLLYPRRRTSPPGRTINSIDLITACAKDLAAWRYSICQSRLPLGLLAGHFL